MTLTLPKLLLLAVVVWLAWTFLKRHNIIGSSRTREAPRAETRKPEGAIEDMVKCPKCGAYVPVTGGHTCPGA